MQFKTLLVTLAALTATVQAAPAAAPVVSDTLNPASANAIGLAKRQNYCGNSSFKNIGNDNSPTVADCERIAYNIRNGGSWNCLGFNVKILSYGTCAFNCVPLAPQGSTVVGATDVRDLIGDSIRRFRRSDGRVGAEGNMECGGGKMIWWQVTRN
ncbi:putative necrosis-inducing factor-domain-containing protein [Podospora conica]|nr:putative necrosis-inducing factor-domain-containing protein [Schizothecium conicum]